jgi:hypothetical protein
MGTNFFDAAMAQRSVEQDGFAMTHSTDSNNDPAHLDLPGNGVASPWTVVIDELPGSKDWLIEIDSTQVYLTFRVAEISVLARAVDLLDSALVTRLPGRKHLFVSNRDDVALGSFGEAAVHLLRDNEDFPRCFLVVEQASGSTLRISLDEGDIRALAEALRQALAAFPPGP